MAEIILRKRPAMRAGEMGLFVDSQLFEEDFSHIRSNVDLKTDITQPHNLKQFRLAWALAAKIAESGILGDLDRREVMTYLLKKCRHVKYVQNKHRDGEEMEVVVKSIRWTALEQDAFSRIFNRMVFIVTSEIIPEMPEGELRAEVEKMAGVDTPEPEPPKKQRRRAATPEKVSTIPAEDSVPGPSADAEPPASADKPASPPPAATGQATPAPIKTPTTLQEWSDYCFAWLKEMDADSAKTDVDVMTKWQSETKLRNGCGITADDRQKLFAFMNAIVDKKREAQAKRAT